MNTVHVAGSGGGSGGASLVEHVEMPDEEELLLIRSSVMGGTLPPLPGSDSRDRDRDRDNSRGGSSSSPQRVSRRFVDSPRASSQESLGEEGKDCKEKDTATVTASTMTTTTTTTPPLPPSPGTVTGSVTGAGAADTSVLHNETERQESTSDELSSTLVRTTSKEVSVTDPSDITLLPSQDQQEDEEEKDGRSVSSVLNSKQATATTANISADAPSSALSPTKDKSTRLTKAIQRFRGKGEHEAGHTAFSVGVEELSQGRLGLPPGRLGRVVAVHEEQLATVIAYSLASEEYYENLQLLQEEDSGTGALHSESEKKRFIPFGGGGSGRSSSVSSVGSKTWQGKGQESASVPSVGGAGKGRAKENSVSRIAGEQEDDTNYAVEDGVDDDDVGDENEFDEDAKAKNNQQGGSEGTSQALSTSLRGESGIKTEDLRGRSGSGGDRNGDREGGNQLDTIPEDKPAKTAQRGNVTSPFLNTSFRNIVTMGADKTAPENDTEHARDQQEEEEDDDDEVAGGHALGHKSFKYLDLNYDAAMKLEGLGPVLSGAKGAKGVSHEAPHSPPSPSLMENTKHAHRHPTTQSNTEEKREPVAPNLGPLPPPSGLPLYRPQKLPPWRAERALSSPRERLTSNIASMM